MPGIKFSISRAAAIVLLASALVAWPRLGMTETELVMFEEAACGWCIAWHEEIGPIYPKTKEAAAAPLRRVDIHDPRPEDLQHIKRIHYTPTFVLIHNGEEVDRLLGYPGEDFFWGLLAEMLKNLPEEGPGPVTN